MSEQQQSLQKRTASQRLDDVENALSAFYQTMDMMARDITLLKDAVKLLGNKADAMVKAINDGQGLSDDTIAKFMVQNNIEELKGKVDSFQEQGLIEKAETITENSFVVGKEIDENDAVVNPRLQFMLTTLSEDVREKLMGAKAGDVITFRENALKFVVDEVYVPVAPKAPEQVEQQASEAVVPEVVSEGTDAASVNE